MKLLGVDTARRAASPEERRHTKEETAISNCLRSAIPQQGRSWWRLWLLTLALVGCDARASVPSDPYDPTTMDFTSPPARITTARQTGPFAVRDALSMTAALKPLDPASVKEVRLDTTHKIIEISPGVKFSGWTFGDQVPGPTIRVFLRSYSAGTLGELMPGCPLTGPLHWQHTRTRVPMRDRLDSRWFQPPGMRCEPGVLYECASTRTPLSTCFAGTTTTSAPMRWNSRSILA